MAIIGVTHCPSCKAVVNACWQTCLACSCNLDTSKAIPTSLQAQVAMESVAQRPKTLSRQSTVQPGMTVQYRIPVRITSPTTYEWEWHQGKIEMIDEGQQLALVIPLDEGYPWRWVAICYIEKGTR